MKTRSRSKRPVTRHAQHASAQRNLAHRFLDVLLDEGGRFEEECGILDDDIPVVLHTSYHRLLQKRLRAKHLLSGEIDNENYRGPKFTIQLLSVQGGEDSEGFILRPSDIRLDETGIQAAGAGRRRLGYSLDRLRNGAATLTVHYGFYEPDHEADPYWFNQALRLDTKAQHFLCPLCSEPAKELFLSGVSSWIEHFGCITCMTTLDPIQQHVYRKTLQQERKERRGHGR